MAYQYDYGVIMKVDCPYVTYLTDSLTAASFVNLRAGVGWGQMPLPQTVKALEKLYFPLPPHTCDGQTIGMGR